jgi:hypothetical protein
MGGIFEERSTSEGSPLCLIYLGFASLILLNSSKESAFKPVEKLLGTSCAPKEIEKNNNKVNK